MATGSISLEVEERSKVCGKDLIIVSILNVHCTLSLVMTSEIGRVIHVQCATCNVLELNFLISKARRTIIFDLGHPMKNKDVITEVEILNIAEIQDRLSQS